MAGRKRPRRAAGKRIRSAAKPTNSHASDDELFWTAVRLMTSAENAAANARRAAARNAQPPQDDSPELGE